MSMQTGALTPGMDYDRIFKKQEVFSMKTVISAPNAPGAIGPYSRAIKVGELLFLSGQL